MESLLSLHNSQNFLFTLQSKHALTNNNNSSNLKLSFTTKPLFSSDFLQFPSHITRVSTAHVEHAPPFPPPDVNFEKEIARLKKLRAGLDRAIDVKDKVKVVDRDSRVKEFFSTGVFAFLEEDEVYLLKCVVAAGQEHLFGWGEFESESNRSSLKSAMYALAGMIENWDVTENSVKKSVGGEMLGDEEIKALRLLIKNLKEIEQFYNCIGGIIGSWYWNFLLNQHMRKRASISLIEKVNHRNHKFLKFTLQMYLTFLKIQSMHLKQLYGGLRACQT